MSDNIIAAVGWLLGGLSLLLLVRPMVMHWIWSAHGRALSRAFDEMWEARERLLDPLVASDAPDEEKREHIVWFLDWMREHSEHRAEWMKAVR
jgi:hypothetical protein